MGSQSGKNTNGDIDHKSDYNTVVKTTVMK